MHKLCCESDYFGIFCTIAHILIKQDVKLNSIPGSIDVKKNLSLLREAITGAKTV